MKTWNHNGTNIATKAKLALAFKQGEKTAQREAGSCPYSVGPLQDSWLAGFNSVSRKRM